MGWIDKYLAYLWGTRKTYPVNLPTHRLPKWTVADLIDEMRDKVRKKFEKPPKPVVKPRKLHYVISDCMDATRHPSDNKVYTSKSEFRKVTKASGCIEVGNEKMQPTKPKEVGSSREDIYRAIAELS